MSTRQNSRRPVPAQQALAPGLNFESGIYLPFNDLDLGGPGAAQVIANGNLAITWLGSTFEGAVDANGELQSVDGGIDLSGAVTMELAVDTSGELAGSLPLAMIPLAAFSAGPSVEVVPYLQVTLRLTGTADAGAQVSLVALFDLSGASTNAGAPELSSAPHFTTEIGPPDAAHAVRIAARIELEITVVFLIIIGGFSVGGPVIGISSGITVEIDPQTSQWDIEGEFEVIGGWSFFDSTTMLPDIPEPLNTLGHGSLDIPVASGPLPKAGTGQTRWSQVYDIVNDDEAVAAVPVDDGIVVVEGDTNSPWLASLDRLGVPRWQQFLTDINPTAMVAATDGDLVVAGRSGTAVRIDRYTSSGAPRWTRTLNVPGADQLTCRTMAPTASNGAVFAGTVTHSGGVETPIVAAVDHAGDVEWSIEIDTGPGSTDAVIEAIALAPTGEILAVGTVRYTDPTNSGEVTIDRRNGLIVRLGAEGDTVTAYAVGGPDTEEGLRIAVHGDGSYAIGGRFGGQPHVWIASFAADGVLRWSAAYQNGPDLEGIDDAYPTALAPVADNGLVVSGYIGAPKQAWILRVNHRGMPVWVKTYNSASADELSGVIPVPGGLFAFGSTEITEQVGSFSDIWVLATSVDGMVDFTTASGIDTENTAVQWEDRTADHTVLALEPATIAVVLDGDPVVVPPQFTTDPANVTGEIITD